MKLLETKRVLEDMLNGNFLFEKQKEAVQRALIEIEITIDNGDPGNW